MKNIFFVLLLIFSTDVYAASDLGNTKYACYSVARIKEDNSVREDVVKAGVVGYQDGSFVGLRYFNHDIEGQKFYFATQAQLESYQERPEEEAFSIDYLMMDAEDGGVIRAASASFYDINDLPKNIAVSFWDGFKVKGKMVYFYLKCQKLDY